MLILLIQLYVVFGCKQGGFKYAFKHFLYGCKEEFQGPFYDWER